jgi:tetratricopeptide (TPR) repeat protein
MRNRISESWLVAGICAGLIALVWFAFGQSIHFPFVNYDDPNYITENPAVIQGLNGRGIIWAFSHIHGGNWHPLTTISHMLDCSVFGLRAGGHHFGNVLLHTSATIALFLMLRRATGALWRSAFVAAVFAIHPLRVESVVWIAERKDILSGLFFMLSLAAYLHYARKPSVWRYLTMSILFACGLMSKPMLVTLPIILLLLDYWPLNRAQRSASFAKATAAGEVSGQRSVVRGLVLEKIPLFALSLLSSVATLIAQKPALGSFEQLPLSWRLGNAVLTYLIYLWQMFWPTKLAVFYPHSDNTLPAWQVILPVAVLVAITVLTIVARKKWPYLLVGWLWYLCMLIPVIGIVQVGLQGHADRYTYLPQIGLYIMIAWGAADLLKTPNAQRPTPNVEFRGSYSAFDVRRWAFGVCCVAIVIALGFAARVQASYWRDSESLWTHTIAVTSNNHVAHAHLADLLLREGRINDAISHCQEAVRIQPHDTDAQNNLGLAYLQLGDEAAALIHFERSLASNPRNLNVRCNLAWVLATSPDPSRRNGERAVELATSVAEGPGRGNPTVLRTLAVAYAETGRFSEAIETAQQAIAIAKATGNDGLAADLERNIAAYRLNQPIRSGP